MFKKYLLPLTILIIIFMVIICPGCLSPDQERQEFIISAGSSEHWTYAVMSAMIPIWESALDGVSFTLLEGTGGGNLLGIHNGQYHFATSNSELVFAALDGQYPFEQKFDGFRALGYLSPAVFHYFAGKDTGIQSFADLRGKTIAVGARGSGSDLTMHLILDAYDIDHGEVNITYISLTDAASAYSDGLVDVICGSAYPGSALFQRLAITRDSIALSLTAADLDQLRKFNPYFELITIPGGTYHNIEKDAQSIKLGTILVCNKDLDEALVYQMLSLLFEHTESLAEVHKAVEDLSPKTALFMTRGEQLHPGAEKYYREVRALD